MYYGGDPPAWTTTPAIPADARYERLTAAAVATTSGPSKQPASSTQQQQQPVGKRIEKSAHPLSGIGGYRMPAQGNIGGARGVGIVGGGVSKVSSSSAAAGAATTAKKSAAAAAAKTTTNGKPMSQEEKEAIARREAARARVAARNAAQFGM